MSEYDPILQDIIEHVKDKRTKANKIVTEIFVSGEKDKTYFILHPGKFDFDLA